MPLYVYQCPYGHRHEELRQYDTRHNEGVCPNCGAPAEYIMSAHHAPPDGIYSYMPDIGSADNYERKHELHRKQMEERQAQKDGERRKTLDT